VIDVKLPVLLTAREDGFLIVECPVIPGCISQGKTREEALDNIKEAILFAWSRRKKKAGSCRPDIKSSK
jgi:predicted RNase H-like HicB family nuclease